MSTHPAEPVTSIAPVFAALGDTKRLLLLSRLSDGRVQTLVQLTEGTGLTRQGVRKHLGVLEHAGIVFNTRVGRESRYAVRPGRLADACRYLERASRQWDDATQRLRELVEDPESTS